MTNHIDSDIRISVKVLSSYFQSSSLSGDLRNRRSQRALMTSGWRRLLADAVRIADRFAECLFII